MQQWVEIAGSKFIVEIWEIYLQNVQNSKEYVKAVKKYKEIHINQLVVISTWQSAINRNHNPYQGRDHFIRPHFWPFKGLLQPDNPC